MYVPACGDAGVLGAAGGGDAQLCSSKACEGRDDPELVRPLIAQSAPSSTREGGRAGAPHKQACAADIFVPTLTPVNMYLMLDRSGSMQQNRKWKQASAALQAFVGDPATAGLRVALRFFGDNAPAAGCNARACDVSACASPLVSVGALTSDGADTDSHEAELLDALRQASPQSGLGTPIYAALGGALQWAVDYRATHADERAVVVFVTDGEPNGCNESIEDIAGLAARAHVQAAVLTYAIGLQGSNEAQIDRIAAAGQTGNGIFIGASSSAELDLLQALNDIRSRTMSCEFALPVPNPSDSIDTDRVKVTLSSESSNEVELDRVESATECENTSLAWYYDSAQAPSRIHLCAGACKVAVDDGSSRISVEMQCLETQPETPPVR